MGRAGLQQRAVGGVPGASLGTLWWILCVCGLAESFWRPSTIVLGELSRSVPAGVASGSKCTFSRKRGEGVSILDPDATPAGTDRLRSLRTMVLGRQNDSARPQTRKIHQNVPRDAPGTVLVHPAGLDVTPDRSGAAQRGPSAPRSPLAFFKFFIDTFSRSA